MATTHQARYFLTERCIRMPHTELSRAVVGGEAPYISGPARQQIAVLLGNAGLAGETRDGLVKTLEEARNDYVECRYTVKIWRWAIRNIDTMLNDLAKMDVVAYFVPDGKDEVTQVDSETCTICMTNKKRLALECGHVLFCFVCADKYVASKGVYGATCPLCAKRITKPMLNVFL